MNDETMFVVSEADLEVFGNPELAALSMEVIDVENGVYGPVYSSDGSVYQISVRREFPKSTLFSRFFEPDMRDCVHLMRDSSSPKEPDALATAIRKHLLGVEPERWHIHSEQIDRAHLEELVVFAKRVAFTKPTRRYKRK